MSPRTPAVGDRRPHHPSSGYAISQRIRKRVEEAPSAGPRRSPACARCGIADCSRSIGNSPSRWPSMTWSACPTCSPRLIYEAQRTSNRVPLLTRAQFEVPPNPPATLSPMIAARSTDRWWPYEVIARTTASVVNRKITGSIPVGPCIWPLASPPEPDPPFRCVERLIARRAAACRRCQERNNRAAG